METLKIADVELAHFAVKAIIAHAFNNMNLRRIELGVLENNAAAIHVYEKVGFVKEGLQRQSNYKNGKYVGMIMMGLLKDECSEEILKMSEVY